MKKLISLILILGIAGTGAYFATQTDAVDNIMGKISSVFGIDDEQQINKQIDNFLTAYNSGDMESAINCLDPKTRSMYKSSMNIGESILSKYTGFGISINDLFGVSVGLSDATLEFNNRIISISDEDNAEVKAEMAYSDIGSAETQNVKLKMIKVAGKWYIKDIS